MSNWNYPLSSLADLLPLEEYSDSSQIIEGVATINNPKDNCMMFATAKKWKENYISKLTNTKGAVIFIEPELMDSFKRIDNNSNVIVVNNARFTFAKALKEIISRIEQKRDYSVGQNNIVYGQNVIIGENCLIEPGVFLDHDVTLGDNVVIKTGAIIRQKTIIGDNSIIGENSVIGAQGLGIETDDKTGESIRIPHIGGVVIGKNVEVGALTSIVAGTIQPTVIEDNSFIDDLNHIAHNCHIGKNSITTGCVEISGSASLGDNSYIAPNATIRNGIKLGANTFVGQASSVQKEFGDNATIVGNPAKEFGNNNK